MCSEDWSFTRARLSDLPLLASECSTRGKGLLQRAQEFVEEVEPLIEQDKQFDLIGGSPGCLLCLLGCITRPI